MTGGLSLGLTGTLGTAVATGLGAAGGSLLGSAANRRDFDDALKRAAVTGLTAGTLSGVTPAIGNAITKIPGPVGNAINTGYSTVMNPLNAGVNAVRGAAGSAGNVIQGGLNAAGELIVTPSVTSAITGGGIGALTGTAGVNALTGGSGADTVGNTVEGVDVTASNTDAVTGGAVGGALGNASEGNLVDEVVVEPEKPGEVDGAGGVVGTIGSDVVLNGTTIPSNVEGLDTSGPDYRDQNSLLEWIKANPLDAARLGLTLAGGIGGVASGGGSGGSGSLPPGFAAAGTRGSLSDVFRAKLPAPSGPFADLSARNVAMTPDQWKTYGTRSEESFYNNVPQRPSGILDTPRRAPPTPVPSAEPERFAKGGFAVRGIGSGRDDKIPARLSDGEYVIDAETVALLGDGSSDAGAKRLDAFRASIRKHKGKKLVRGEFSVNAKKPEAYLKGGRV
jgi:hypothetical protein